MSTDTSLALDLLEGLDLLKKKGLDVDHLMVASAGSQATDQRQRRREWSPDLPSNALLVHLEKLLADAEELHEAYGRLKTGRSGRQYGLASLTALPSS